MNTQNSCPQCGAKLPDDAPEALCPACLMSKALPSNFDTVKLAAPPWSKGASVRYVGDYELLEEVAKGGMGVVWKARQTKLDRLVAVKMIRGGALAGTEEVQRFHAEAQAAANLKHPNIVSIHEVGEHEGQHYYSMDFIEGTTLADVCHGKAMNAREAAELLRTVCDAVHFAHQRGVLHRDLKPHNLMLDASGQPHVLDFGLAKRLDDDQGLTMSGAVLGSPSYMAPEQAQGRHDRIGTHTDVYALGAILYQMLTGRPPFLASSAAETMMQVVQREPSAPSRFNHDIPRALETICLKCLEKEPARRYATARELGEELARFLKGEPILAQPASITRRAANWLRQHPGWLAGAAALFVFGLLCAMFYLYQENAFMRAQQLDPSLKRAPGGLAKSLVQWTGFGSLLTLCLCAWVNIWFRKHQRRTTWRNAFDWATFKKPVPVPAYVRAGLVVAGLAAVAFAFLLVAKVIQAQVWEGGVEWEQVRSSSLSTHLVVAFAILWVGFVQLLTAWRDQVRSTQGLPVRNLDEATRAAIRAAMEQGDIVLARKRFQQAVPEAGFIEAGEYAAQVLTELRAENPARFDAVYDNPWSALKGRYVWLCMVLAIIAVAGIAATTPQPGPVAWYLYCGLAYGFVAVISASMRGFVKRLLIFATVMIVMQVGGDILFDRRPAGHLLMFIISALLGIGVMRLGKWLGRK